MSNYMGITIGPIVDTLMLAKSPAAMWYASSTFSKLTETICRNVTAAGKEMKIISPHYDKKAVYTDGIGRYHDRVIIENADEKAVLEAVNSAVEEIAKAVASDAFEDEQKLSRAAEFMKDYLQVHCVYLPELEGNAVLETGDILNCLEQMSSPNANRDCDPFLHIFGGTKDSKNSYIDKKIKKMKDDGRLGESQLYDEGKKSFRSLDEIAKGDSSDGMKHRSYYVIVEADGDSMGKYIESIGNDITKFSDACFKYAGEASQKIADFGGMTVYAGGDDLLFISPVVGKHDKTVFDLCREISDIFREKIKTLPASRGADLPTVSFGIAIRRNGFPLYEALNSSLNALFAAKSEKVGKNAIVIDMQKGSGQAMKIAVPFKDYDLFDEIFGLYHKAEKTDKLLRSAIYVFGIRRAMFEMKSDDEAVLRNIVINTFDNEGQSDYKDFVNKLADSFCKFMHEANCSIKEISGSEKDISETGARISAFEAMLRLGKFMTETGSDKVKEEEE